MATDKARLNVYISPGVAEWLDEESKRECISKSVLVQLALKTYMDQQEMLKLNKLFQQHALQNELDKV